MTKITLFTGPRGAGKSTRFIREYHSRGNGLCFFSLKKRDDDGNVCAYDLVLYPENETLPFFVKDPDVDMETASKETLAVRDLTNGLMHSCSYFVHLSAFDRAMQYYKEHPEAKEIWIDEIGRIEVAGKGFYELLMTAIANGKDVFIVVRNNFVPKLIPLLPTDADINIVEINTNKTETPT